ncbi:MAG: ABC transporter family substrate-binding protein [Actinomycetota bacterium]|nr:ABC transporter family substrate-binding protein [Actinomycetota bacterium]
MRTSVTVAVAVAAAVGVLAGCGSSGSRGAGRSTATTAPPEVASSVRYDQNAALTMAVGSDPGQWNCDVAGVDRSDCLAVVDRIWPSVYRVDANGQPQLDRTFVESATQTAQSPQTIVYKINPKAAWSDGTRITVDDFVYNWQAQSGSPAHRDVGGGAFSPAQQAGYAAIASVTASPTDPGLVTVVFAHPYPDWQSLFGSGDPLVPAQVAQRIGYDAGFTDPVADVISAGPYQVQSYTRGQAITLVRNPRYWGVAANLASVTFRFVSAPVQLPPGLKAGEIGAATLTPTPGSLPDADVYSAVKALKGVTVDTRPTTTFEQLDLDQATPALADPNLRHAIMLAVPRSAMLKRATAATDASSGLLDNRYFVPGSSGYQDNSGGAYDSVDLTQARQILTRAGYASTPGSALTKDGRPVTLRITSMAGVGDLQAEEQIVITALDQLGITVSEADSPDLAGTLAQGGFDLAIDTGRVGPFLSQNDATYQTGGAANVDHATDPGIDALVAQADTTYDPGRRQAIANQIDRALWADYRSLPLFQLPAVLASQSKYLNVRASSGDEGPTFDLDQWGVAVSS